jgi:hypothetical protein
MEHHQLREFCEIFFNHKRVVFEKEIMQVFRNEVVERQESGLFVVEVGDEKRCTQRI